MLDRQSSDDRVGPALRSARRQPIKPIWLAIAKWSVRPSHRAAGVGCRVRGQAGRLGASWAVAWATGSD